MSTAYEPAPPVTLIPEDAPFSADQRAWLNGFFLGLLSRSGAGLPAVPAVPAVRPVTLTILHASQTGTAEGLARKFGKEARGKGYDARPQALGAMSMGRLAAEQRVLIIASTHGDGEAPDSALALEAELAAATGTPLTGMQYAVLALGDRNYAKFCRFGVWLDERLAALGGTRLIARIEADGAVDPPYQKWREQLWPLLAAAQGQNHEPEDDPHDEEEEAWSRERPYSAPLLSKARITATHSDKETRHIALSLAGSGLTYEPGDALGVWPRNAPEIVERMLELSGCTDEALVQIDGVALPLREALSARRELGKLNAATVNKFAALTGDEELRRLAAPEQGAALQEFLHGRDAVDLLARHPRAFADAQSLIDMLPALAPRLYSISSSLAAFPDEVHLTVGVVRYDSHGRSRGGLASTFLADRVVEGDTLPIYVHRNARFRMPQDAGTPLIMIGPGTGIAPFRGFLHDRRVRGLTGRTWLFFGDRRKASDFLYEDELLAMQKSKCLTRLSLAFSRDQAEKIYVQHRMLEAGRELWDWMQEGAIIYVCGDAAQMAKDVDAALQAVIARQGGFSPAQAQLELRHMSANGRYVRDVY